MTARVPSRSPWALWTAAHHASWLLVNFPLRRAGRASADTLVYFARLHTEACRVVGSMSFNATEGFALGRRETPARAPLPPVRARVIEVCGGQGGHRPATACSSSWCRDFCCAGVNPASGDSSTRSAISCSRRLVP